MEFILHYFIRFIDCCSLYTNSEK